MLWHFGCDLLKTVESACLCYIRIQSMLVVETVVKTFDYKLKNEMKWDERTASSTEIPSQLSPTTAVYFH